MKPLYRIVMSTAAALVLGATLSSAAMAVAAKPAVPVITLATKQFGTILSTRSHRALYYWSVEKRAGGKVRCTGACAAAWPPLIVRAASSVPRRLPNVKGTFGVIRRPDGRLQVTHNRLPIYTYAHEGPDQVLCDDVDGWFVVRV